MTKGATITLEEILVRVAAEFDNIHPELKTYDHWVVWKAKPKAKEGFDKVPYNARTHERASSTDSRTWSSFDEAVATYVKGGYDGIGFVLSSGDPYTVLDLDKVRDPETGELSEWAVEVIHAFNGYTELSPSGKGVHIYIKGEPPSLDRKEGPNFGVYWMKRFITATGVHP